MKVLLEASHMMRPGFYKQTKKSRLRVKVIQGNQDFAMKLVHIVFHLYDL